MAFEAGNVVGSVQLKIDAWKQSVATVKGDLDSLSKMTGLPKKGFDDLKGAIGGLGISLKSELEEKLKKAEAALATFGSQGQLTALGQDKLKKSISDIKDELAGMTKGTGDAEKAHASLAGQFALGQFIYEGTKRVFGEITTAVVDGIKDAADYEKSVRQMNSAFEQSGRTMPGMVQNLKDYADQLQAAGLADDQEVISVETLLLKLTHLDEAGIKEATRGAIGMADTFGGDLLGATEAVARGFEGNYLALNKMFPSVRNATTDAEKHAAMMRELEKAYKTAEAGTDTYAGSVKRMSLSWGEAKKTFGEAILNTGILQKAMEGLTAAVQYYSGDMARQEAAADTVRIANQNAHYKMLQDVAKAMGWSSSQLSVMVQGYQGEGESLADATTKMRLAIVQGKLGADAKAALIKATNDHTTALKGEGKGYTETGAAANDYTEKLDAMKKELGLTFNTDTIARIDAIKKALELYKGALSPESEKKLRDELKNLENQFKTALPPARDLKDVLKAAVPVYQESGWGFDNLDDAIKAASDQMMVSENTVRLMTYEVARMALALRGIYIPDLRIPSNQKTGALKDVDDMKTKWEGLFSDLIRGVGDSIGEWIKGSKSLKDVWKDLCSSMLSAFTRFITDAVSSWLTGLMKPLLSSIGDFAAGVAKDMLPAIGSIAGAFAELAIPIVVATGLLDFFINGLGPSTNPNWQAELKALNDMRDKWVALGMSIKDANDRLRDYIDLMNKAMPPGGDTGGPGQPGRGSGDSGKGTGGGGGGGDRGDRGDRTPKGGFAEGGWVSETGLYWLHAKERVLSREELALLEAKRNGPGAPAGGAANFNFSAVFQISAIDGNSVRDVVRQKVGPELIAWIRANVGKQGFREALGV